MSDEQQEGIDGFKDEFKKLVTEAIDAHPALATPKPEPKNNTLSLILSGITCLGAIVATLLFIGGFTALPSRIDKIDKELIDHSGTITAIQSKQSDLAVHEGIVEEKVTQVDKHLDRMEGTLDKLTPSK